MILSYDFPWQVTVSLKWLTTTTWLTSRTPSPLAVEVIWWEPFDLKSWRSPLLVAVLSLPTGFASILLRNTLDAGHSKLHPQKSGKALKELRPIPNWKQRRASPTTRGLHHPLHVATLGYMVACPCLQLTGYYYYSKFMYLSIFLLLFIYLQIYFFFPKWGSTEPPLATGLESAKKYLTSDIL